MPETGGGAGDPTDLSGESAPVNHRKRFSLLVVRGDGARVVSLAFSWRWVLAAGLLLLLGVSTVGALAGDWWQARQRLADVAALVQQLEHQRAVIAGFNARVAELRAEIAGRRELHARIWEPFGPDMPPRAARSGIGGRSLRSEPSGPVDAVTEELNRLAASVMEESESLRALEQLISKAGQALVALPSRWPLRGAVNSEFGRRQSPWSAEREFHSGIDIAAERGTPVRAPAPGTVVFAGPQGEYGLTVIVEHSPDVRTVYGHLGKLLVKPGQRVERGMDLALSGNTGRSSGPHLHYEILVKGQPVNPRAYLWD
jgi:biotin carboxyl carrier protein